MSELNNTEVKMIYKNGYVIEERKITPKEKKNSTARKYKYIPNGKGVYCIVDIDKNLYIGSTSTSFKDRYSAHVNKENRCTSAQIVASEHRFGVLLDMSEEDDIEVIKLVENEFINLFKDDAEFNLVNKVGAKASNNTSSSKCIKTVKLTNPEKYHDLVLEILNTEVNDTLETIKYGKDVDVNKINEYLQSIVGEKLNKDKQSELVNVIGLGNKRGNLLKSFGIIKSCIDDNTNYILERKRIRNEGKQITVWIVSRKQRRKSADGS